MLSTLFKQNYKEKNKVEKNKIHHDNFFEITKLFSYQTLNLQDMPRQYTKLLLHYLINFCFFVRVFFSLKNYVTFFFFFNVKKLIVNLLTNFRGIKRNFCIILMDKS